MSRQESATRVPQHVEESRSVEMEEQASLTAGEQDANPDARPPQESGAADSPFDILLDILQRQEWVLRTGRGSQEYLIMMNYMAQGLVQLYRDGRSPILRGEVVPFPRQPPPPPDSEED